jgi:hypothetical protein
LARPSVWSLRNTGPVSLGVVHSRQSGDRQRQAATDSRRHRVIGPSPRRARQRHDGGRRSRHLSDPRPGAGGRCRLEAAHSVPPEVRTCDRRPRQANAVLQIVPDEFGLPLRFAARTTSRHRVTTRDGGSVTTASAQTTRAPSARRGQATRRRQRQGRCGR